MDRSELRILFAGNPEIAVPTLRALAGAFRVVGVLTNPDRPAGRGKHLEAPPVKSAALELGLPVLQYDSLKSQARKEVSLLQPNLLVSFACGHYFGPRFLALFSAGAINIHPSLLPLYRGCAPIQGALLHGDAITGVSIQRIVSEVDCGDILACEAIALDGTETAETLAETASRIGAELIIPTLERLCEGDLLEHPQDNDKASFSGMLSKQDGIIDWKRSAREIHAQVRALYPWPKASTTYGGVPLIIAAVEGPLSEAGGEVPQEHVAPGTVVRFDKKRGLAIACGDGLLYVRRLQLSMKKELDSQSFVNGNPGILGSVLGK